MVLRQALEAQRLPLQPGQLVRFAHPLNDGEEAARFTLITVDGGAAYLGEPVPVAEVKTITRVQAWEVEPC